MQHLMIETIARLIDEAPTADQATHLEQCDECRTSLEAMRADLAALRNLPMIEPPPTEWDQIESRLLEEGLIRRRSGQPIWRSTALRVAATIAVFVFGASAGVAWTGGRTVEAASGSPMAVAGSPSLIMATEPGTPEETLQLYRQAEALYLEVLTRVAALEEEDGGGDPVARLAALEGIANITRSALDQAPADPVLNGYHLTALAQREATIRQIAASKPGRWF
ncbi:MAG TPA: hypothetical protein VMM79_08045 [Longimicrobiales bacterium]|nr:hypothetical protein [Longimicrobiales bacterium]